MRVLTKLPRCLITLKNAKRPVILLISLYLVIELHTENLQKANRDTNFSILSLCDRHIPEYRNLR